MTLNEVVSLRYSVIWAVLGGFSVLVGASQLFRYFRQFDFDT